MSTSYQTKCESTPAPSLNALQALVQADMSKVNEVIIRSINNGVPLIPQLASHIIAAGGKRLRPALTLLSAKLCNYTGNRHIQLAACIELIHTATLLHDDVVDESALRRGNATANEIWGNKSSVLVGDFLLSRAFQLMVQDGSLVALKILADASATIAQGEVMQLTTANNLETTEQEYLDVITAKTATLFAAACELGAVVTDKKEHNDTLRSLGLALGIAFQIMDDTLDYVAQQETLGKTIGDDFREGKITLPVIFANAHGTSQERAFWKRTLEDQQIQDGDLEQAIHIINKYEAIEKSVGVARQHCETARRMISGFKESPEKNAILEAIDFCTQRAY